jgi:hypothetical protein
VDGGVSGDLLEDSCKDSALELFEMDLWCFEKAKAAGGFEREVVVVVTKARRGGVALEAFDVGKPEEFGEIDVEPVASACGDSMVGMGHTVAAGTGCICWGSVTQ